MAGRKRAFDGALLVLVVGAAVVVPALVRKGARAMLALMVVGSVAVVGYLPSTITSSPGEDAVPVPIEHGPDFSSSFVSADAVVSVMSDCTSCHDTTVESYPPKQFPDIPHQTEGWEECSFCHAPARLAPAPQSHEKLPDAVCQACHQDSTIPPPSLGHVLWQDKTCSSCHGTSLEPVISHNDRGELSCTLCHERGIIKRPVLPDIATDGR